MVEKKYDNKNEMNAQGKRNPDIFLAKRIHFESIDSTNTWAKMHPHQWAPQGVTLITADGQTAGRGRFKRSWVSPAGLNIYATFCFWIHAQPIQLGHIPQILALAAVQTLEKERFFPFIKWPNDLLLQGKKVAGILCETILEQDRRGIVCGIGLNVNMPSTILNQIDQPATSLLAESGCTFEVPVILEKLQKQFLTALHLFMHKGFKPFFPLFEKKSILKQGHKVHFHDNQTLIEAKFEALQSDGAVQLRLSNGELKVFYAGEFIN